MQKTEFVLSGEYIELNNLLKLTGVCDSGGAGKALVASGAVTVDGQVETRKTCKIRAGQKVAVGDIEINVLPAPESGIAIAD
jgi:ribosome-associated protein